MDPAAWLEPMLSPRSIAIVGASDRAGSFGRSTLEQTIAGGFTGEIFPVNPRLSEALGLRCYPSLADRAQPTSLCLSSRTMRSSPNWISSAELVASQP